MARHYRHYLPLFPAAAATSTSRGYDLVISSSHCVAKGVQRALGRAARLLLPHARCATCGTATTTTSAGRPRGAGARPVVAAGRRGACAPGTSPPRRACDHFAANSGYVAGRIRRYYGRDADGDPAAGGHRLLHARPRRRPGAYDLVVSALVPYKRLELVLDAYRGTGRPAEDRRHADPRTARLRAMRAAGGRRSWARGRRGAARPLPRLPRGDHAGRRGLRHRARRGHGLRAARRSSSARAAARSRWSHGETGVVFHEPTPAALRAAVDSLPALRFNTAALRARAETFSRPVFESRFRAFVDARPMRRARTGRLSR